MRHMGNYPTLFTIEYWNDVEERLSTINGLIYADSIVHAAEILEEYYGNIEKVEFQMYEQGILEFNNDQFKTMKEYVEEQNV